MVADEGDIGPLGDPNLMGGAGGGISDATVAELDAHIAEFNTTLFALQEARDDADKAALLLQSWVTVGQKLVDTVVPIIGKVVQQWQANQNAPHPSKIEELSGRLTKVLDIGDQLKTRLAPNIGNLTSLIGSLTGPKV